MKKLNSATSSSQVLFIGIDVHLRTWKVCIRSAGLMIKTFSCEARPENLFSFLKKHYPDFTYHTVYEAGFCGFWIHHEFIKQGINSIVINPADVPTTNKEKTNKSDIVDCKKLARELENGSLKSIYIPPIEDLQYRSVFRRRQQTSKDLRKSMLRVTSFLYTKGYEYKGRNWSLGFRRWVDSLELLPLDRFTLDGLMQDFSTLKTKDRRLISFLRKGLMSHERFGQIYSQLINVPGIGPICTIAFICEVINMKRFSNENKFASFIGLIPSIRSSDQTVHDCGIHNRCQKTLRTLLIQAAWISVRNDPSLLSSYSEWTKRMKPQKAIIKVAKKLANRIRHVWLTNERYVVGIEV